MDPKRNKCRDGLETVQSKNKIKKSKRNKSGDGIETVQSIKVDKIRKLQLLEANKEEDREIKRLEKLLKLNKKKKSKKTSSTDLFGDDLDYLLDYKNETGVLSDDSEDDKPSVLRTESNKNRTTSKRKISDVSKERPQSKNRTLTELLREKQGHVSQSEESEELSDQEDFSESENESVESEDNEDSVLSDDKSEPESKKCKYDGAEKGKPVVREDIYGRLRDEKGNVIKSDEIKKYVPPALRKTAPDDQKEERLRKIRRNLMSVLNRLSESNLQPTSRKIEEVYMKNSRNDVNETLFSLVSDLVLTSLQTTPRLIMDQAMLISILHANVGVEIGAYFLEHLVKKLDSLLQIDNYGEGKLCNNVLSLLSHLYIFKVAHSQLIFDIFRKFIDSFKSKDIELIYLFLKNVGFILRKDDPVSLTEIVKAIQEKASTLKKEENDSRINFMLETLAAVRNNNNRKIKDPDYDPGAIEHSKKVLKGLLKKDCYLQEVAVSYEDLIKADERGRWWIVGSAWSESDNFSAPKKKEDDLLPKAEYSEKILKIAKKRHLNTDIKKSIFCVIMAAEDYMDAFQKLLKLNLKKQQQKEMIGIILNCALDEKRYNPYYGQLAEKFCRFDRDYMMSLKYSLWDKFKKLNEMKPSKISNLSKFLSHCFNSSALPLSVLKVLTFSQIDVIRPILLSVLLHEEEETCIKVFSKISKGEDLKSFRDRLNIFMYFMLSEEEKYSPEELQRLKERVEIAKRALYSAKKMRTF